MDASNRPDPRARMRADLPRAMKARDKDAVDALRTALAAFDDAEVVAATPSSSPSLSGSEHVAGASAGLWSAEVPRRELTVEDLRAIVHAQIAERAAEADTYTARGQAVAADRLRRQADVLRRYLD